MKQFIISFFLSLFVNSTLFCQDYVVDYPLNNGYTLVYKNLTATTQYQSVPEKTYGVINSENKIVVPLIYKSILNSGEKGIFIVKPGLERAGLFSVITQKMIVEPQYYDIESFKEGQAIVKIRKPDYSFVWGAIDVNGNVVIPVEYDYLGVPNEGLMHFRKEKKSGYIDKTNKIMIPAMYSSAQGFSNGLAAVQILESGKFGYIDKNNKLVIAADYEDANPFYDGFAAVAKKKGYTGSSAGKPSVYVPGQWVVIDKTGKLIQERSFDRVSSLNAGGLFIIESNGKKGTMNTKGMPILPMEYTDVTIDKNGYTIFKTIDTKKYGMMNNVGSIIVAPNYDYVSPTTANRFYVIQNGKYTVGDINNNVFVQPDSANGVILGNKRIVYHYKNKVKIFDLNGNLQKTITDLNLKNYGHQLTVTEDSVWLNSETTVHLMNLVTNSKTILPFSETGDFNEEGIFIGKNTTYNFYDHSGKKLNTKGYYSAVNFSEGICALQETSSSSPYLADKDFKKIKELSSYFKGPFSEGLAYANSSSYGKLCYLTKTGAEAFSIYAKEGGKCTAGFIPIKGNDNRFYHVNKNGKSISSKTWESIDEFKGGLALVKDKGKWGFIDTLGKIIIEIKYEEASSFYKGAAVVKSEGRYFLINKKGEAINSNTYEAAGNPDNGTFPVKKDKQAGLIDSKGNTVIDFKYNGILFMGEDRVWAAKEDRWGLLDNKGKALTGFIYDGAFDFSGGYARIMKDKKMGLVNKAGKTVIPAVYSSLGAVYKNSILGIVPEGKVVYNIK